MLKRILLLLVCLPLLGQGYNIPFNPQAVGGGGCVVKIAVDDFGTDDNDPLSSSNWREAGNSNTALCAWFISSGTLRMESNSAGDCDSKTWIALNTTSVAGADQWCKVTLTGGSGGFSTSGCAFRADSVTETAAWLNVGPVIGELTAELYLTDSTSAGARVCSRSTTIWADGDVVGIKLEGSGESIQATLWRNPSGATPDDWGPATGDDGCVITTTGLSENTGNIVGVRVHSGNINAQHSEHWTAFSAGSCS